MGAGVGARQSRAGLVAVALVALACVLINPLGYGGGGWDDGRYLETILAWHEGGPQLGTNHWALRWPVVLAGLASVELFGLNRWALMLPPLLAWIALLVLTWRASRHFFGETVALIATAALVTVPELARWTTRLNPDVLEVLFWSASLWALAWAAQAHQQGDVKRTRLALIGCGLAAGLAWATRETSLGLILVLALALLSGIGVPRKAWGWVMLGGAIIVLPEMAILWAKSGNPIYRLHVDLHHTLIHSNDMAGGVAPGQEAPLNPEIMKRWDGAGPVRWHWAIDPWINFFANHRFGLAFLLGVPLVLAVRKRMEPAHQKAVLLLALVAAANIFTNLYLAATDPKVRMFMPAIVALCLIIGLSVPHVRGKGWRRLIAALFIAKLICTLAFADMKARFAGVEELAEEAVAQVEGPLHVNRNAGAHLLLASPPVRARLVEGDVPVGGILMSVGVRGDAEGQEPPPEGRNWQKLWQRSTDHVPLSWHLVAPFKKGEKARFKAVQISLYRRLPDKPRNPAQP